MNDQDVREEWQSFARQVDRDYRDAKDSQGALPALFDRYRQLQPAERDAVDRLLGETLDSADENARFDALALAAEFRIRSLAPQLLSLAARLNNDRAPGAPFELAKVKRVLSRFDDIP